MKIKAILDFPGSLNGFDIQFFKKGSILDIEDTTARIFLEAGFCEPITKEKTAAPKNAD